MTGRFESRPTRFTGVVDHSGLRIKWYEISLDGRPIADEIVQASRQLADHVCRAAGASTGVGFGIVHHGAESVWVLLDRWQGDIVSQHTWSADLDDPARLTPVPAGGPTACVWELVVHAHERDAFIRHVLDPADGPDLDRYLADILDPDLELQHRRRNVIAAFTKAWTDGDLGALMELMADEPVYRPSIAPDAEFAYRGRAEVRHGFAEVIAAEGNGVTGIESRPADARESVTIELFGNGALSFWSYGDVEGVDLWTFDGDRIAVKDAYRKTSTSIQVAPTQSSRDDQIQKCSQSAAISEPPSV